MEGVLGLRWLPAIVAGALLIAVAVLAGCGVGGDATSREPGGPATTDKKILDRDPTVYGGPTVQIAESIDDVQDALMSRDGGICFELTDAEEKRLAAWAGQPGQPCFNAVGMLARRRQRAGVETVRSRVLSVRITETSELTKATVTVQDPTGGPYRVRYEKAGTDDWGLVRFHPLTPSGIGQSDDAWLAAAVGRAHLLVRGVDPRAARADGGLFELGGDRQRRRVGELSCKQVHMSRGTGAGLCLAVAPGGAGYEGIVFDRRFRALRRFPAQGIPDRVRVSPDGRFGAYTSFDPADAQGYFTSTSDFSTYTRIHDMRTGRELLRLEDLHVTRDGRRISLRGAELWGVTFAGGGRYYATLATGPHHYLIAGRVDERRARVVRDHVECPALSPDGHRIAYKRRIGRRNAWRFHVLDLRSGHDVALAERRSIDDQPEWLDRGFVVYSDDKAVFAARADGTGKPSRVARLAASPAPVSVS